MEPITGANNTASSQINLLLPVNSFFSISINAKMNGTNPIRNAIIIISNIPNPIMKPF